MKKRVFHHWARSWTATAAAWIILFNGVLMALFCGICLRLSQDAIRKEVESYVDKTLDQAVIIWDNTVNDLYSRMLQIKNLDQIRACLMMPEVDYVKTLDYERTFNTYFKEINLFRPVMEDVMILGNNGYIYNLSGRSNLLTSYRFTEQPWFQTAIDDSDGIYIRILPLHDQRYYNPRIEAFTCKETTFSLSMAIMTSNREVIGAIVCSLDLEALGKQLMSSNYEKSGKIALITQDGTIIGQNDNACIGDQLAASDTLPCILNMTSRHALMDIQGRSCLVTVRDSITTSLLLVSYIPIDEIDAHAQPLTTSFFFLLTVFLLGGSLLSLVLSKALDQPVRKMVQQIASMDETSLTLIKEDGTYTEINVIAQRFNELLTKLDHLIHRDYTSQLQLKQFQLSALQAQIRPHFLFNTLQLLQTEILYQNFEESNAIIVSLSRLLRYTMATTPVEVPLSSEMKYLRDYLYLFEKKYDGQLSVDIRQPDALNDSLIPRLLLQPIVENCIRHAFGDDPKDSHICIDVTEDGHTVTVSVSDDGQGISPEDAQRLNLSLQAQPSSDNGIGLGNVHQRLRRQYGECYGVTVMRRDVGMCVQVTFPKRMKGGDDL